MISITINNESHTVPAGITISKLLQQLDIPTNGIALAINQEIISQSDWETYILQDKQNLLLIKATQGG